jgi:xanthine/CO dehydrogenase XdhC/CoxF family maturation factor
MEFELHRLLPFFERERAAGRALALAAVIDTAGSTYRKPGAFMLIARDGTYAGLLSGGCLEGDLRGHAARVIDTGEAAVVAYDMRGPDDLLFGLGSGCEGAMRILVTIVGAATHWAPFDSFARSFAVGASDACALVTASQTDTAPVGRVLLAHGDTPAVLRDLLAATARSGTPRVVALASPPIEALLLPLPPAPRLLLCGGGPDALPVVELAEFLGWRITVCDHRSAYADPSRFPRSVHVVEAPAELAHAHVSPADFDAAVVMSHHLASDLAYLRQLAHAPVPYVGLLGPPARREKLLADLGTEAARLAGRLRAPVGLDLGARAPHAIALAIVAEIQAHLAGAGGGAMSAR